MPASTLGHVHILSPITRLFVLDYSTVIIYGTGGSDIVHLIVNDTVFTVNRPKLDRIFSVYFPLSSTRAPHRLLSCIAQGSVGLLHFFVSVIPCYHGFVCGKFTVLQDVGAI